MLIFLGLTLWKRRIIRGYFGKEAVFASSIHKLKLLQGNIPDTDMTVGIWASKPQMLADPYFSEHKVRILRIEDAFIRSNGLGSKFYYPYSLVFDDTGIYYDPSQPSALENQLNSIKEHPEHDALIAKAQELINFIQANNITKYSQGKKSATKQELPKLAAPSMSSPLSSTSAMEPFSTSEIHAESSLKSPSSTHLDSRLNSNSNSSLNSQLDSNSASSSDSHLDTNSASSSDSHLDTNSASSLKSHSDTNLTSPSELCPESTSTYTATKITLPGLKPNQKIILVPGQVDTDASIITGGFGYNSMKLLNEVRDLNPDAYIIFKIHPDVLYSSRKGETSLSTLLTKANLICTDNTPVTDFIDLADEVHTISSLSGFDALLRNKKVFTYGMPFYAAWGLTTDKQVCTRRQARLSLAELVACALILYPRYYDWNKFMEADALSICKTLVSTPDSRHCVLLQCTSVFFRIMRKLGLCR